MTKEMNGDFTEPPAYNNLALIKTNDLDTTKSKPQASKCCSLSVYFLKNLLNGHCVMRL